MAATNISFRTDEELKERFEAFCEDVGMNMTTAFTMFMKATLRDCALPFKVSSRSESTFNPYFSKSPRQTILDGIEELKNGGGTYHELIEPEDDDE